jgi:hypothetical protein
MAHENSSLVVMIPLSYDNMPLMLTYCNSWGIIVMMGQEIAAREGITR